MAIYHLEAKVVSRGTGRSACAASAYLSCSAIYNDYDGVQHDYTRKQGLVASGISAEVRPNGMARSCHFMERRGGNGTDERQPPCP